MHAARLPGHLQGAGWGILAHVRIRVARVRASMSPSRCARLLPTDGMRRRIRSAVICNCKSPATTCGTSLQVSASVPHRPSLGKYACTPAAVLTGSNTPRFCSSCSSFRLCSMHNGSHTLSHATLHTVIVRAADGLVHGQMPPFSAQCLLGHLEWSLAHQAGSGGC